MTHPSHEVSPIRISLCIPTYNRSALLEQALSTLLEQWHTDLTPAQRSLVEIAVSDNCSPDDTRGVVQRQAAAYPGLCLTYFCQTENKGGDANILHAMQMGHGEFVYLLSDDDILMPHALAKLFALMDLHPDADGFCLNTKSFVCDVQEDTPRKFRLQEDLRIVGKDEGLRFLGTWITFISALAFRRTRIAGRHYEERIGTLLLPAYLNIEVLAACRVIVVTRDPFLAVRDNNAGGYNFFEIFVTRFAELMHHAQSQGFSRAVTQKVLNQHLIHFIASFVATFKVHGSYGRLQPDFHDGAQRLLAAYGPNPFLIFGLLPLMFAPRRLVLGLRTIMHIVKRRPAAIVEAGKAK